MTTLSDILLQTYRFLEDVPRMDSITADISGSATPTTISISVNDPTQWPVQGRMEIGNEMFLVKINSGSNPITVQRAYESTIAAPHKAGDMARGDPRFLRQTIVDAINYVLASWCTTWFPRLVWDNTTAGAFTPINWIYAAPDDAVGIRRVCWVLPGFNRFVDVAHSQLQSMPISGLTSISQSTSEPTGQGQGFELHGEMGLPGTAVTVLYEKRWLPLINDTDILDPGFPEDGVELLVKGAILFIAGARQVPRYRVGEVMWYREQNSPLPAQFNQQWLLRLQNEWVDRAKEVVGRRPQEGAPSKVWIGALR